MQESNGWNRPFFAGVKGKIELIAHRGGAGEVPGETLLAFEHAVKLGADVLEMDVHSTRDRELVLIHNETVNETTDGTGYVDTYTLERLQKLNAGYRWTADGKTFPYRSGDYNPRDIRVPTLREVFERFGDRRMVIEIKQTEPSIVKPLGHLIREYGMTEKVLVASFYHGALKELRRAFPEIATSASTVELVKFVALHTILPTLSEIPDTDAIQVGIRFKNILLPFVNSRTVRAARAQNIPIQAWTVNRLDDMRRVIELEVDGIITDYPTCLSELLKYKQTGAQMTDEIIGELSLKYPACAP
jgi:glycerophosphoryl diester phosphodiesterase